MTKKKDKEPTTEEKLTMATSMIQELQAMCNRQAKVITLLYSMVPEEITLQLFCELQMFREQKKEEDDRKQSERSCKDNN